MRSRSRCAMQLVFWSFRASSGGRMPQKMDGRFIVVIGSSFLVPQGRNFLSERSRICAFLGCASMPR
jgi:hypothetical protein